MNIFSDRTNWQLSSNKIISCFNEVSKSNDIIDLTASNPTKCGFTPEKHDILEAFDRPCNLLYTPDPRGMLVAREEISRYYEEKGLDVDPNRIFLTSSTSEGYSFLFRLLSNPGDNVLFPSPSYPLFQFLVDLNDIAMNKYSLEYADGWVININSVKEAVDDRSKAIVLVNPNNPTGSFVLAKDLIEINDICSRYNIPIVCDEVFGDFLLNEDAEFISLADNKYALSFVVSGISKILGMPQMKLSWIVVSGPDNLVKQAMDRLEVISDTYLSVNTPVQNAFLSWMNIKDEIQRSIIDRIRTNLKFLRECLVNQENIKLLIPDGGWYAVLSIKTAMTEEELVLLLLKKHGIFVHPGYFFDLDNGVCLVISLLANEQSFSSGIKQVIQVIT